VEFQPTESEQHKELIEHLAYEWSKFDLPGTHFRYHEYVRIIRLLLTATESLEQTKSIFMTILKQAVELGKTSFWVEREVRFETLAQATDRVELNLSYLKYSGPVDDGALDAYNERKNRFNLILELKLSKE
jgi:hypothetical protein